MVHFALVILKFHFFELRVSISDVVVLFFLAGFSFVFHVDVGQAAKDPDLLKLEIAHDFLLSEEFALKIE